VCGESGSLRDLEYVTWHVSVSVLQQMAHWKLRASGVWTVEPARLQEQSDTARAALTRQRVQW
jgi:hypothetical protein